MKRHDLKKKGKRDKGNREVQKKRTQLLKGKRQEKNDKTKSILSDENILNTAQRNNNLFIFHRKVADMDVFIVE